MQGPAGPIEVPYLYEHTAQTDVTSPMNIVIASGSFVAQRATVELDVEINAVVFESLGGWASFNFWYAAAGVTPITPKHQADAVAAGVAKKQIGALASVQGGIGASTLLTGLTPGTTYNWEISCGIIGGAGVVNPVAFAQIPNTLAFSKITTLFPEMAGWGGLKFGDGSFSVIKADHVKTFTDTIVATFTAAQMGVANANKAGWVASTPDGSRLITTNQGDNTVTVVITGAGTNGVTPPSVQGSYAVAAGAVSGVACAPDNTTAWVALPTAAPSGIQKVTLASGAVGAIITGFTGSACWDVAVGPANDYVYVAVGGPNPGVAKVRVADNSIVSQLALSNPAASGQLYVDISADGTTAIVVASTSKRCWKVRVADMAELATVVLPQTPTGIVILPDGQSFLVSSSTTTGSQIHHRRTDDLSSYTQWSNALTGAGGNQATDLLNAAYDIALGPRGAIYVPNYTKKWLNQWFGGWLQLHCGNASDIGFFNDKLTVRVRGAA